MYRGIQRISNARSTTISKWLSTTQVRLTGSKDIIDLPDDPTIKIKEYETPLNESLKTQRARLIYQSRKRAILENDLLLSNFAAKHLEGFNKKQLDAYDKLINMARNDWDIYYWITNKEPTPDEFQSDVIEMLKKYVHNKQDMTRIRQPDL